MPTGKRRQRRSTRGLPLPMNDRRRQWQTARAKRIKENWNQSRADLPHGRPRTRLCNAFAAVDLIFFEKKTFRGIFFTRCLLSHLLLSQHTPGRRFSPNAIRSAVDGILLILLYTSSSTVRHAMYSDKVEVLRFETEPYRNKNGSPNKNGVLHYNNNHSNKNHNNPKHFIFQNGYHNTSV